MALGQFQAARFVVSTVALVSTLYRPLGLEADVTRHAVGEKLPAAETARGCTALTINHRRPERRRFYGQIRGDVAANCGRFAACKERRMEGKALKQISSTRLSESSSRSSAKTDG